MNRIDPDVIAATPARPRPQTNRAQESVAPVTRPAPAQESAAGRIITTLTPATAEAQADGAP